MSDEALLREKLRKLEALFAGAGTPGEKNAAEAGLERQIIIGPVRHVVGNDRMAFTRFSDLYSCSAAFPWVAIPSMSP